MSSVVDTPAKSAPSNLFGRLAGIYRSPIGKKLITGVTGLGLVSFVLIHMLGNLTLFYSAAAYNQYAYAIERLGPLTYAIELGLLGFVIFHAVLGIQIYLDKRRSRPIGYARYASAGEPSRQTLSSRTMIWTGLLLSAFLVWHLATFKFGPRYPISGTEMRDLSRLVIEKFQQPLYTVGYTAAMGILGFHLRHGIWSAFQSLGVLGKEARSLLYALSLVLAGLIAVGFLGLPLAIYLGWVQ
ncbi:succinate dehydrogenase cytochrome b subunit [Romeria aff. gracilis LEGE 07310]|uniref:Succinate dehydrogenase cytochrome b subunit n=1 Tax=Vasconcelosia minhoensis LEGE 07310 TaxID=915328 RepID=A0A8J7AET4_9CYAN|nr:succinate dehydrogenase cytochrome b subunit [Romeria gracilis]MBE9076108.1 succinate dehydrogenase cytochrome b subunit [Romeria aff. gracilis LEGE 07310]